MHAPLFVSTRCADVLAMHVLLRPSSADFAAEAQNAYYTGMQ